MKTEQQTRIELIDVALKKAGWNVDDPGHVVQEYDILVDPLQVAEARTPYGGHQFSDYVLLGRDRKPLAVVEAKKTSKDAALGREQAKQYCYNICKDKGGELPFCFYTNGLETYFWDLGNYPPRKIVGFPTLDDLERFLYIRQHKKSLTDELINTDIAGRDYQIRAIRAVLEGIERIRTALEREHCPKVNIRFNTMFTLEFPRPTYLKTDKKPGAAIKKTTPQVTPQVTRLLEVLQGEMTRGEIMKKLSLKDRMHFSKEYLTRAIDGGYIEMTIPDKPNSRFQRYRLTDKGRRVIEGDEG